MQAEVSFQTAWLGKWDTVHERAHEFISSGFGSTAVAREAAVVEVEVPDLGEDE